MFEDVVTIADVDNQSMDVIKAKFKKRFDEIQKAANEQCMPKTILMFPDAVDSYPTFILQEVERQKKANNDFGDRYRKIAAIDSRKASKMARSLANQMLDVLNRYLAPCCEKTKQGYVLCVGPDLESQNILQSLKKLFTKLNFANQIYNADDETGMPKMLVSTDVTMTAYNNYKNPFVDLLSHDSNVIEIRQTSSTAIKFSFTSHSEYQYDENANITGEAMTTFSSDSKSVAKNLATIMNILLPYLH